LVVGRTLAPPKGGPHEPSEAHREGIKVLTKSRVAGYRDSEKRLNFLLTPSDSREPNKEYLEIAVAQIHEAALRVIEERAAKRPPGGGTVDEADLMISPIEVYDSMLERAGEEPLSFVALFDLIQEVISQILQKSCTSGEHGDADHYRRGKRFATLIDSKS